MPQNASGTRRASQNQERDNALDSRDPRLADPEFYQFWVDDNVRFSDQDAAGHINNTAIAQYVESGRVGYMHDRIRDRVAGGRFVAANLTINYLKEAHYPGRIRTGTRVVRIGGKSLTVGFGVFKDHLCIACGVATLAYLEGMQTEQLPDTLRDLLSRELPGPKAGN